MMFSQNDVRYVRYSSSLGEPQELYFIQIFSSPSGFEIQLVQRIVKSIMRHPPLIFQNTHRARVCRHLCVFLLLILYRMTILLALDCQTSYANGGRPLSAARQHIRIGKQKPAGI